MANEHHNGGQEIDGDIIAAERTDGDNRVLMVLVMIVLTLLLLIVLTLLMLIVLALLIDTDRVGVLMEDDEEEEEEDEG